MFFFFIGFSQQPCVVGTIIIYPLQMWKLRLRKLMEMAQLDGKGRIQNIEQSPDAKIPGLNHPT